MKVFEVFDPDWDNHPEETLEFLSKRQAGLSDEVELGIRRWFKQYFNGSGGGKPPGAILQYLVTAINVDHDPLRLYHYSDLNQETLIASFGENAYKFFVRILSTIKGLKQAWDLMIDAKLKYEKAGGFYMDDATNYK